MDKIYTYTASIISGLFHPIIAPFYGFLILLDSSVLKVLPDLYRFYLLLIVLVFTTIIPVIFIFILKKLNMITSVALRERKERLIPYIIIILCYVFCTAMLFKFKLPGWSMGMIIGSIFSLITLLIINTKWKISAHATGVGGILACLFYLYFYQSTISIDFLTISILVAGAVGSSRVYLGRHTLGQVLAGYLNGFAWVLLLILLNL